MSFVLFLFFSVFVVWFRFGFLGFEEFIVVVLLVCVLAEVLIQVAGCLGCRIGVWLGCLWWKVVMVGGYCLCLVDVCDFWDVFLGCVSVLRVLFGLDSILFCWLCGLQGLAWCMYLADGSMFFVFVVRVWNGLVCVMLCN